MFWLLLWYIIYGRSTASADHRLDTVIREAEKGFDVCLVCEFENFKDVRFRFLCGERLDTGKKFANRGNRYTRRLRRREERKRAGNAAPRRLTERQVRARKRKEWTRKLDVEGNMFWFRAKEGSGPLPPARVGKVIRFVKPNENVRCLDE